MGCGNWFVLARPWSEERRKVQIAEQGEKYSNKSTNGSPTQRALDAGDCRFAACGTYGKQFSGFEFFLLPSRVHARPSAVLRERQPLGALPSSKKVVFSS